MQCDVPLFETYPNTNKARDFGVLPSSRWQGKIFADHLNINNIYVFRINDLQELKKKKHFPSMPIGTSHSTYGSINKKFKYVQCIPHPRKISPKTYLKRTCNILVHAVEVLGMT